jgi:putative membrane protein
MAQQRNRTIQALILALLGFFLLERIWSGKILLYINQRYVPLIFLAGVGLIILAQAVFQERRKAGESGTGEETGGEPTYFWKSNLVWVLIPLVVGIMVPARSLGTSSLAARGIEITSPFLLQGSSGSETLARPAAQRTVLDWIRAFHASTDPNGLNGNPVDVIGFVYHDPRLQANQFLIGRYTIACCIADATAIGIWVNWDAAASLTNNQWVRIQGKMTSGQLDGQAVPVILADAVDPISEPDQPYLFP